jgi:hypothetical protein
MHRSLVIDAFEMGVFERCPQRRGSIFHSDRGSRCRCTNYSNRRGALALLRSSKARSWRQHLEFAT